MAGGFCIAFDVVALVMSMPAVQKNDTVLSYV